MVLRLGVMVCLVAFVASPSARLRAASPRVTKAERQARRLNGDRVKARGEFWNFGLSINGFSETKRGLGLDVSYTRQHGYVDDRYTLSGGPLRMADPHGDLKFDYLQLQAERRFYVRNRLFWNLAAGCNRFSPRSTMKDHFLARGERVDLTYEPFARVGLGWYASQVTLFRRRYPLVLRVRYTVASAWEFPSALPDGASEIDPAGASVSVGLRFRF